MRYKSKHNLLRWFLEDHATLPASYVKSCEKFFRELAEERGKLQATSDKPQATSVKQELWDNKKFLKWTDTGETVTIKNLKERKNKNEL